MTALSTITLLLQLIFVISITLLEFQRMNKEYFVLYSVKLHIKCQPQSLQATAPYSKSVAIKQ